MIFTIWTQGEQLFERSISCDIIFSNGKCHKCQLSNECIQFNVFFIDKSDIEVYVEAKVY